MIISIISFINSNYFEIEHIKVVGNNLLKKDYLINSFDIKGENLLRVNSKNLANEILELPEVRGASISRSVPNKLVIEINERRPIGMVGGKAPYQIIDKDGWILATSNNLSLSKFPLFMGVDRSQDGKRVELEDDFKLVVDYLSQLPDWILDEVYQVEVFANSGIELFLRDNIRVKLGLDFSAKSKSDIFIAVYSDIKSKRVDVDYIDLRYENNIIVKLKE
nr:cell division protein FtsQ/DivIB [Halonatronum saccharophilum]